MLLDFTVSNYRSIKEPVTLSAVAQKQRRVESSENGKRRRVKSDEEIAPVYSLEAWDIGVLPVLGIFGPNASGKSNLVQALDCLLLLMRLGNSDGRLQTVCKSVRLVPFALNQDNKKNISFELRIVIENIIYTYTLTLNQNQVISETLDYESSLTKRSRCLFHRSWDAETQKFIWNHGRDFSGPHLQLMNFLKSNELFIHLLDALDIKVIEPLLSWLRSSAIPTYLLESRSRTVETFVEIAIVPEGKVDKILEDAIAVVKKFDTGIHSLDINKKSVNKEFEIYALHETQKGNLSRWLFEEESLGTQRLLDLALLTVFTLDAGSLMIVDEISASIHPNITKEIIRMFQSPKTNPKRAQLIFTSHDNTLQRNNLLRRDQIWFTQKRPDHSTELYPLTDFKVRRDLAIDKAYLDGRFGAVPILPSEDELLAGVDDE